MTSTALAPGLARKVKKILETRTEAPEIVGSLSTLSQFYGDNTPAARRQLRSTIENEGVKINEDFLAAAEGVIQALDVVQADLESLASCCDRMSGLVATSKASSSDLLADLGKLRSALEVSQTRSQLVARFLDQYQLAPAEMQALQGEGLGEEFFSALEHVRSIHANCRALLRSQHQRAGLELMDTMAAFQEAAYEKLCRWVQAECRGLSDVDAPEVNPLLQRAAAALRERQVLFQYCAEEVASARHTALFQRFIKALTRGPRPIEMHAHDPRRYLGDMMAWVHQSLASEREFLVSLFGEDPGSAPGPGGSGSGGEPGRSSSLGEYPSAGGGGVPTIPQLLDSVFESICRPLKVRIEQVLLSSPPPLLCFRLSQLLTFYLHTVERMLGGGSQLAEALRACRAMALRIFHEQIKQRGEKLVRYPPAPPRDLSPPQQLLEGAAQLTELIECYESALHEEEEEDEATAAGEQLEPGEAAAPTPVTPGGGAASDFRAVLAAVADPLVEMCERASEALNPNAASRVDEGSHLDPTDQQVFMVNCLFALQAPLVGHPCAAQLAHHLGDLLEKRVGELTAGEAERTLAQAGMAEILERMQLHRAGRMAGVQAMAADPALSLYVVGDSMRALVARLSDPAALPELPKLQVPRLKAEAIQRVLRALADAYTSVHNALTDPSSGYQAEEVAQAVPYSPAQVATLLGVAPPPAAQP